MKKIMRSILNAILDRSDHFYESPLQRRERKIRRIIELGGSWHRLSEAEYREYDELANAGYRERAISLIRNKMSGQGILNPAEMLFFKEFRGFPTFDGVEVPLEVWLVIGAEPA